MYRYVGYYYWYVDGTLRYSMSWNRSFESVVVGLESYMSGAVVSADNHTSLQYTIYGGGWTNWATNFSKQVDSQMCGTWLSSPRRYRAGQNVTC